MRLGGGKRFDIILLLLFWGQIFCCSVYIQYLNRLSFPDGPFSWLLLDGFGIVGFEFGGQDVALLLLENAGVLLAATR